MKNYWKTILYDSPNIALHEETRAHNLCHDYRRGRWLKTTCLSCAPPDWFNEFSRPPCLRSATELPHMGRVLQKCGRSPVLESPLSRQKYILKQEIARS